MSKKACKEMTFNEFVDWSACVLFDGVIVGGAGEMKNRLYGVLAHALENEVFGVKRKEVKGKKS